VFAMSAKRLPSRQEKCPLNKAVAIRQNFVTSAELLPPQQHFCHLGNNYAISCDLGKTCGRLGKKSCLSPKLLPPRQSFAISTRLLLSRRNRCISAKLLPPRQNLVTSVKHVVILRVCFTISAKLLASRQNPWHLGKNCCHLGKTLQFRRNLCCLGESVAISADLLPPWQNFAIPATFVCHFKGCVCNLCEISWHHGKTVGVSASLVPPRRNFCHLGKTGAISTKLLPPRRLFAISTDFVQSRHLFCHFCKTLAFRQNCCYLGKTVAISSK
jgi:hypothetical protein